MGKYEYKKWQVDTRNERLSYAMYVCVGDCIIVFDLPP